MGDIVQTIQGFVAVTGGKPKRDWSGLVDPSASAAKVTDSLSHRAQGGTAQLKGQELRETKLSKTLKYDSDLTVFSELLSKKMVENGMDTIAYIPDPFSTDSMAYILTDFAKFPDDDKVREQVAKVSGSWDQYDRDNNKSAINLLYNSVDAAFADRIRSRCRETDNYFPIVWIKFVHEIVVHTPSRWEHLRNRIKQRIPQQYAGQDIRLLCDDFEKDAKELSVVAMYDHQLTRYMLESFLKSSGDDSFKHELRDKLIKLKICLDKSHFMERVERDKYMADNNMSYLDICDLGRRQYLDSKHNNSWLPGTNLSDSKAPPKSFNAAIIPGSPEAKEYAMYLLQQVDKPAVKKPPSTPCPICKQTGHWKSACPQKVQGDAKQGTPLSERSKSHEKKPNSKKVNTNWKRTDPGPNGKKTVNVGGVTFQWCAKCRRFTKTHNTETHQSNGQSPGASIPSPVAGAAIVENPGLFFEENIGWVSESNRRDADETDDYSALLLPYFLLAASGYFFLVMEFFIEKSWWSIFAPSLWTVLSIAILLFSNAIKHLPRFIRFCGDEVDPGPNRRRGRMYHPQYPRHLRDGSPPPPPPTAHERTMARKMEQVLSKVNLVHRNLERMDRQREQRRQGRANAIPRADPVIEPVPDGAVSNPQIPAFAVAANAESLTLDGPSWKHMLWNLFAHAFTSFTPEAHENDVERMREASFPIIWDSGASVSLSFCKKDFVGKIKPVRRSSRIRGIKGDLDIKGIGTVRWAMFDDTHKLRIIEVPAYYAPDARTRLLSTSHLLQTYEGEEIAMQATRIRLTGIQGDPRRQPITVHVSPVNNLPTNYAYGDVQPTSPVIEPVNDPLVCNVISTVSEENRNLTPAQKELLRWHYKLGHIDFRRIQYLLRLGLLATNDVSRAGSPIASESNRRLHTMAAKLTDYPKCAACMYGKQVLRHSPGRYNVTDPEREGALKHNDVLPGAKISVDHFVCGTKGRLFSGRGKTSAEQMFTGGCVFVDHCSGYIHVEFQSHLNSHETLRAKQRYEQVCNVNGVFPRSYVSDGGTAYTSEEFNNHLSEFRQNHALAAPGAHHHNGVAERSIRTITTLARTMMLHAGIHWPEMMDIQLWPMAVSHAVHLYNLLPNPKTGLSARDLFTRNRADLRLLHNYHVWGSPVYVLDKKIANGMSIPKWKTRSARYVYMGMAKQYAASAPLVLNPESGNLSAQWHTVFDDWFNTIASDVTSLPALDSPEWPNLFSGRFCELPDDSHDMDLDDDDEVQGQDVEMSDAQRINEVMEVLEPPTPLDYWLPPEQDAPTPQPTAAPPMPPAAGTPGSREQHPASGSREQGPFHQPFEESPAVSSITVTPNSRSSSQSILRISRNSPAIQSLTQSMKPGPGSSYEQSDGPSYETQPIPLEVQQNPPLTGVARMQAMPPFRVPPHMNPFSTPPVGRQIRSPPVRAAANRLPETSSSTTTGNSSMPVRHVQFDTPADPNPAPPTATSDVSAPRRSQRPSKPPVRLGVWDGSTKHGFQNANVNLTSIFEYHEDIEPEFHKAARSDPDTLSYDEAKRDSENWDSWSKAMQDEVKALESQGTWDEVPKSDAKDKIIPGTWVFRRKRSPDGDIKKYKARFCVRGDLQEGVFETYAPVVSWSSVRIFLVVALTLGWDTLSIDFSNAFVQAKLDKPVWIYPPRGFGSKVSDCCLRLKKSLYGLTVAPRLWYQHLFSALIDEGFTQSAHDPCFLYRHDVMIVVYVDDAGIASSNSKAIATLISNLENRGFQLTQEGTFSDFLGIKFSKLPDGSIECTQKGLISKIIATAGMEDCRPNWTPASPVAVGSDPDGAAMCESWSYPSIIGMMLYLCTNTRPDISFAVSQVARFTHAPKQSHATAVKTIIRYLARTRDKGTIVQKTNSLALDCYVDADFAGLYKSEPDSDPVGAKSRTGYMILLGGCPLVWKSTIQSHISLSTLEAEYSALSSCLRAFIPIRRMLCEIINGMDGLPEEVKATFRCQVFEDNSGALTLAVNQRTTSRTKYFHVMWHHFWDAMNKGEFEVLKIGTTEQLADYLTKGLPRLLFENNRKGVQGF
jgi:Reverse transcriptase (RNA-dependent DNA polymerase)